MIVFVFVTPVMTAIMTCSGESWTLYLGELRGHVSIFWHNRPDGKEKLGDEIIIDNHYGVKLNHRNMKLIQLGR